MKTVVAFLLAGLALSAAAPAVAQPVTNWVAVGQSGQQTILLQPTVAIIYANGERRSWVKTIFAQPQTVDGETFASTLTLLVFDCAHNQAKIVDTHFLDASGASVFADPDPDAAYTPIVDASETAFVKGFVCTSGKKPAAAKPASKTAKPAPKTAKSKPQQAASSPQQADAKAAGG
jgi:hypothetical protein